MKIADLSVGDQVSLVADAGELERLVRRSSVGWNSDMASSAGATGTVRAVDLGDSTVRVQFASSSWWLTPSVLRPAVGGTSSRAAAGAALSPGVEVRALGDAAALEAAVRASSVGWNDRMANVAGLTGTVMRVDDSDNTVRVQFGSEDWWFPHPALVRANNAGAGSAEEAVARDITTYSLSLIHI